MKSQFRNFVSSFLVAIIVICIGVIPENIKEVFICFLGAAFIAFLSTIVSYFLNLDKR